MDQLGRLSRELPLPGGWSFPDSFVDTIDVGGNEVSRAGLSSRSARGLEVVGAAAQLEGIRGGPPALARAWFELWERAAVLDACGRARPLRDRAGAACGTLPSGSPDVDLTDARRRPARSNGVALHETWDLACERALLELVERDRVLGSWYGELELSPAEAPAMLDRFLTHEWRCALVERPAAAVEEVSVAIVVGFPREASRPLARGFAARRSVADALGAAALEAVQGLAFLWDEAIPSAAPELSPTPMFHLDHYLVPATHPVLRGWLDGAHHGVASSSASAGPFTFVDLTPPGSCAGVRVARAISPTARPLVFGEPDAARAAGLPAERRVHPIP